MSFPMLLSIIDMVDIFGGHVYDALSPLLGAASARLGSSSLEQQDATIG